MCQSRAFKRKRGSWQLKGEADAFGNMLESELGTVYTTVDSIAKESNSLNQHFQPDGYYGTPSPEQESLPGYISDITDFSQIVCFAIAGSGEQFCFDFREDAACPSVIWWDDIYWRRIAPGFPTFVELFDFASGG
jgi:hypothetical protein